MYKFLPSKKFLTILGSIILATAIVWLASFLIKENSERKLKIAAEETELTNIKKVNAEKFLALDTDGDGLKDWEEALWKTSASEKDSDKDGTSDGEEVVANRDPAKKGPGDEIDPKLIAENKKADEDFAKLSPTDQFAQVFFSQYIDSKSSSANNTLSTAEKQAILDNMINSISKYESPKYKAADLILSGESKEEIKKYGNDFGKIIIENFSTYAGNEILYLSQAIAEEDEAPLKNLDPILGEYEKTIALLLKVPTPIGIMAHQTAIINSLDSMRSSTVGMKQVFADSLTAVIALEQYQTSANQLLESLGAVQKYFKSGGVEFSEKETGYVLLNFNK
jgi:hypothetical protein